LKIPWRNFSERFIIYLEWEKNSLMWQIQYVCGVKTQTKTHAWFVRLNLVLRFTRSHECVRLCDEKMIRKPSYNCIIESLLEFLFDVDETYLFTANTHKRINFFSFLAWCYGVRAEQLFTTQLWHTHTHTHKQQETREIMNEKMSILCAKSKYIK
jgi:hypothetical protein